MTKRQFILSMLASLLAGRMGFTKTPATGTPNASGISLVSELFSDINGARIVGQRYLAAYPHKADRNLLLKELEITPRLQGDRKRLRQTLAKRRQQQFLAGDTVIVDGWVLARSEAQLCALLALS